MPPVLFAHDCGASYDCICERFWRSCCWQHDDRVGIMVLLQRVCLMPTGILVSFCAKHITLKHNHIRCPLNETSSLDGMACRVHSFC